MSQCNDEAPALAPEGGESAPEPAAPAPEVLTARQLYTKGQTFGVAYKSEELMVIDKPPDVRIDGDFDLTAEKWVAQTHPELVAGEGHKLRLCHQLDYATSGLLVLGFRKVMAARVTHCFQNRLAKKLYLALIHGHPSKDDVHRFDQPVADDPTDEKKFRMCVGALPPPTPAAAGKAKKRKLEGTKAEAEPAPAAAEPAPAGEPTETAPALPIGRSALTYAKVLAHGYVKGAAEAAGNIPASLVLLAPCTGRRHQLRVHCQAWGHPIVGDLCYHPEDRPRAIPRMMLHAWKLHLPMDTTSVDAADSRDLARSKAARRSASIKKRKAEREDVNAANDAERDAQMAFLDRVLQAEGGGLGDVSGFEEEKGEWIEFTAANRLAEFFTADPPVVP
eukprot:TRINITY_DN32953_c0_g1_i1.p1 TRINITY_DN32953_c0_g1~~TRINITY_DN32953_c0_g1_i1.p1  ORF type:complete len:391 (+),score=122.05 TRINITY_DN32953_c0_g1_i1:49-1221(+)